MSTIIMRVCEECRTHYVGEGGSLVVASMHIKSAKRDEALIDSDKDLDFCSQGCFMRYTAKRLEKAITDQFRKDRKEEPKSDGGNGHDSKQNADLLKVA